jgi:hypothetical protein
MAVSTASEISHTVGVYLCDSTRFDFFSFGVEFPFRQVTGHSNKAVLRPVGTGTVNPEKMADVGFIP